MAGQIDLKRLTTEELAGVVSIYPWFAGARKELCLRMRLMEGGLSIYQIAESAMHMPSRKILSDIIRPGKKIVDSEVEAELQEHRTVLQTPKKRVYAGAGDYFSQDEYDAVRKDGDNIFSRYSSSSSDHKVPQTDVPLFEYYTETLAQIYAEQGYYEHAKEIYSKLILAYPEKNAYFAALIKKIDELN